MTLSEKCKLWIEAAKKEHISDGTFDELSNILYKRYDKLPKWFRDKVSEENLRCGTTFDMDIKSL